MPIDELGQCEISYGPIPSSQHRSRHRPNSAQSQRSSLFIAELIARRCRVAGRVRNQLPSAKEAPLITELQSVTP